METFSDGKLKKLPAGAFDLADQFRYGWFWVEGCGGGIFCGGECGLLAYVVVVITAAEGRYIRYLLLATSPAFPPLGIPIFFLSKFLCQTVDPPIRHLD